MKFSEKLAELRVSACLTQQAAAGAGLSLRGCQNYEHGLREPKMTALIALADFCSISLDELACRDWPGEAGAQK